MNYRKIFYVISVLLFISGCAAKIEKPPEKPVDKPRPALVLLSPEEIPSLVDDLDWENLSVAIEKSIGYYNGLAGNNTYRFGDLQVSGKDLKESLLHFQTIMKGADSNEVKQQKIEDQFDFYKATGFDGKGAVLFTGYFEPVMEGSLEKKEPYNYPIYKTPDDVVVVNLSKFKKEFKGERLVGRVKNRELVPYFTREEIEKAGALSGKNLEIVWVKDPVELFFLHIQGSGTIKFHDGEAMQVSYAQSNGHSYRSVGKYLLNHGKLAASEMTHQSIKKYLKDHPDELSDIMNYNSSYVFFRMVTNGPVGALGLTLTGHRSIATDLDLFPRGMLALIRLKKPVFDSNHNIGAWKPFTRFVLNQDTGGVIKGPGRVDIFCGTGNDAEWVAGSLKERGELYFLIKKQMHLRIQQTHQGPSDFK